MELRLENIRLGREQIFSVICQHDGQDRLIIQTTNYNLAKLVLASECADGFQIPKEFLERQN